MGFRISSFVAIVDFVWIIAFVIFHTIPAVFRAIPSIDLSIVNG